MKEGCCQLAADQAIAPSDQCLARLSARTLQQAEVAEARAKLDVETINMATGLLLPVWNKLPDDDLRVWRVSDADGNSILGRIISPSGLAKVATAFSVAHHLRRRFGGAVFPSGSGRHR
jgi:hypothetical protein